MEDDERDEAFFCTYEATHVEEADELAAIVSRVDGSQHSSAVDQLFDRYHKILEKYHEQAQLLDPLLASLVTPLSSVLRREADNGCAPDLTAVQSASRFLWALITVRGHKTVVKFFSSEVADLEPVLALLLRCDAEQTKEGGNAAGGLWQAQCTLLLWLSQLLYIPFSLASVDSSLGSTASQPGALPPLTSTLLELSQRHLSDPGGVRDMAGVLLGRLLTRPDCTAALGGFLAWAHTSLQDHDSPRAVFTVPGVARTLAHILEQGQRSALLPFARQLWPVASQLLGSRVAASSALSRKLALKLAQRVALALLPPRVLQWRYMKRCADITDTLAGTSDAALGEGNALQGGDSDPSASEGGASPIGVLESAAGGQPLGGDPDDVSIPEEVEEILGALLESLADKDTVVRWSAAKGIGRVSARLPKELADEVLEAVLDLFSDGERDAAWHGGCLALAELARRGLLLPHRLPDLAPLIASALQFDVRRGAHSVGAHVRDAAAYVCWAFARAYEKEAMAEAARQLAPALLAVACYDREVNCRRACSAAFQEAVGRQGSFPHGIDVICRADYFALASRSNAYLLVAPFVAGFVEYRAALVDHLIDRKLGHWERSLRELASRALAALAQTEPELFAASVLDRLLPMCTDGCLEVRHGSVLAAGEVLLALHDISKGISRDRLVRLADVVPALEAGRLYRGKGGELMRAAASRLLECMALSRVPLTNSQRSKLLAIAEDNLRHPNPAIQAASAAALRAFSRAYLTGGEPEAEGIVASYIEGLRPSAPVAKRQGYAAALAALPACLLRPQALEVLDALGDAAQVEGNPEQRDAEARAAAARAIADVASELYPVAAPGAAVTVSVLNGPAAKTGDAAKLETAGSDGAETEHTADANLAAESGTGQLATAKIGHAATSGDAAKTETATAHTAGETGAAAPSTPNVHAATNFSQDSAPQESAEEILEARVLLRLVTAAADYCTDDRGDVGSWVREAAMGSLAQILPLWAAHRRAARSAARPGSNNTSSPLPNGDSNSSPWPGVNSGASPRHEASTGGQQGMSGQPGSSQCRFSQGKAQSSAGEGAGRAEAAGIALGNQAASSNVEAEDSSGGIVREVACALLQQAAERLDRLRKAAAEHLQRLLQHPLLSFPDQAALETALLGVSPDLFATPQALGRLAPLLAKDTYREAVLEGLVACIGGLDGHLSKASSAALVGQTRVIDDVSGAGAGSMRSRVALSFLAVWRRNAKSPRLALPLLKAADVLISDGGLENLPQTHPFFGELLELVKSEARGCRDVPSLCWAATSLCHLAGCHQPACSGALHALLTLLAHRFPKVRKSVAEQLYVRLLTLENHPCYRGVDIDTAQEVLCDATWDGLLAEAKAARDTLSRLMAGVVP